MTLARTTILCFAILSVAFSTGCSGRKKRALDAEKLNMLGQAKLREGDAEGAVADLTQASRLAPKNAEIRHSLGLAYWGKATTMGEESLKLEAEKILLESFELKGKDGVPGDWHNNLGALYVDLRRWEDAIVQLNKALKDPEYRTPERPLNNLAKASLEQKKCQEAFDYSTRALKIQPRFCMALVNKGLAAKCLGKKDDALDAFLKVIEIEECSTWAEPYLQAGVLLAEMKKPKDAKQHFQKAKQADPDGPIGKEADRYLKSIGH